MIAAAAAVRILSAGALGVMSGLLGGLFGIGGGVIAIPLLGLLYGLHQQIAQGTVLVMVVPNVLFGFWNYRRRVGGDLRIAAALALPATVSTYPAAELATRLDPYALRLAFAAFLAILALIVAYRTWRGAVPSLLRVPLHWRWTVLVGLAGGIVSGLFGVGGAFIVPPALTAFFGIRQIEAQGLGLALVSPVTLVALFTYARAGEVAWELGIPLAIGGFAAIPAGIAAAHRLPERQSRLAFCGLLFVTAVLLALHG
ncbi:MAG: sulfite exporter TauE/SafE family protein [Alphaproteobacteria bacterium]|nr:sulfite exporter TauE/SafE family protein [Alphaproteobacteria bacterium]